MPFRRVATRRVTFLPAHPWTHRWKYTLTCHAVIAVSDFIRQLLIRVGVPESMIELIPDGIEIPAELPTAALRSKVRARWGFGDQEFVVGHLGAFTPEKGQDIALDAFGLLAERLPQARLLLAGDGPMRASAPIVQKLEKARDHVQLCENIEELADFYPALDLFVMPSRAEGLGSAALHAMAFGIPVVASRVGGLPEIVSEGETGWLIPADSPEVLAEAILGAASDTVRLRRLGEKARERAQQFSTDIMLARTEALYVRLLKSSCRLPVASEGLY
jgi:glycosyltransferase involved in cell wall biosynthesis